MTRSRRRPVALGGGGLGTDEDDVGGVTQRVEDGPVASVAEPAGASVDGRLELAADPPAPGVDGARLFLRDNGSGKTQLCVRFNTGAVQVLATQP